MKHITRQTGLYGLQLLLLASLLLPAFVPSGYMVKRNEATDIVELTVCPGVAHHQNALAAGAIRFELDGESTDTASTESVDEPAPCPLASSTLAALLDISLPAVLAVHAAGIADAGVQESHQTFRVLPPVRAPPSTS